MVSGLDQMLIRYAKCCDPLPGDRITGFITRGRGVTVHKVTCPQAISADPQRLIKVHWADEVHVPRRVKITIHCQDQLGLLAKMSHAVNEQGGDIKSAQIRTTKTNKAVLSFEINVESADQLSRIRRAVEMLPGVIKVERVHNLNSED